MTWRSPAGIAAPPVTCRRSRCLRRARAIRCAGPRGRERQRWPRTPPRRSWPGPLAERVLLQQPVQGLSRHGRHQQYAACPGDSAPRRQQRSGGVTLLQPADMVFQCGIHRSQLGGVGESHDKHRSNLPGRPVAPPCTTAAPPPPSMPFTAAIPRHLALTVTPLERSLPALELSRTKDVGRARYRRMHSQR